MKGTHQNIHSFYFTTSPTHIFQPSLTINFQNVPQSLICSNSPLLPYSIVARSAKPYLEIGSNQKLLAVQVREHSIKIKGEHSTIGWKYGPSALSNVHIFLCTCVTCCATTYHENLQRTFFLSKKEPNDYISAVLYSFTPLCVALLNIPEPCSS